MFDANLVAEPQFRFVDSIDSFDSSNGESDTWSCRSEKCISLEELKKYLTLILWHSPCFALSPVWSIRSITNGESLLIERWQSACNVSLILPLVFLEGGIRFMCLCTLSQVFHLFMYPLTRVLLLYRCKSPYNLSFIYTTFGVLERNIFMCLWPLSPLLPEWRFVYCRPLIHR